MGPLIITSFYLIATVYSQTSVKLNNACKTFEDYNNDLYNNPNCYYNPDADLSAPEIIQRHGYQAESHSVTTEDGYILTVFRIPPKTGSDGNETKPPIFLQHGIGTNSASFVDTGNNSLAFLLANEGYDVWLGNFRGCIYSDKHVNLKTTDQKYWNFTFHENGVYDLYSELDLVANITKTKMVYMGYSLGVTAYFVLESEFPDFVKERVEIAIGMAPVVIVDQLRTALRPKMSFWNLTKPILPPALNQRTPEALSERAKKCLPYPEQYKTCRTFYDLFLGADPEQIDPEIMGVTTMQDFDSICTKTVEHFIQMIESGGFVKYNYGIEGNKIAYGTAEAPAYKLSNANVPVYLIRGKNDLLATKENVERLYEALPPTVKLFDIYVIPYEKFSHSDFIHAKDVKLLLYDHVIEFLHSVLQKI